MSGEIDANGSRAVKRRRQKRSPSVRSQFSPGRLRHRANVPKRVLDLPKEAMSSDHAVGDLNGLSYVVLTLIGRNGASAHDLVQMARRGQRLYWAGAESKVYAEPKRLERLGYGRSREEPGKKRPRTDYTLTHKGCA